jgi:hypothetical protein
MVTKPEFRIGLGHDRHQPQQQVPGCRKRQETWCQRMCELRLSRPDRRPDPGRNDGGQCGLIYEVG